MIDFLIKSTFCLSIFIGFYHLMLEREKMHQFNRFYLLSTIVISLVIPFITFEIIEIIPVIQNTEPLLFDTIPVSLTETTVQEKTNYIPLILWSLYSLIGLILFVRFGRNSLKLINKANSNPTVKFKNSKLVLVDEKIIPHTFLNFIYINFDDYNNRNIEDELYTHELVHVTQKHTLDILFIELLKVIFWFNPIFIFYKKAIQLNHEFLADEEIVKTYNNVPFYQNLLLQKSSNIQTIYLASNLNYLVTKKRLIMMTKSTSKKMAIIKKIAIVPILSGLIYFFCIEIVAQEKDNTQIFKSISTDKTQNLSDNGKNGNPYYKSVHDSVKKPKSILTKIQKEGIEIKKIDDKTEIEKLNSNIVNKLSDYDPKHIKSGYIYMNNGTYFFVTNEKGEIEYYNRWGYLVNEKGEKIENNITTLKKEGIELKKVEDKKEIEVYQASIVNKLSDYDTKNIKSGYIYMNNGTYFFVTNEKGDIEYYNRWGYLVNEKGEKIEK